MPYVAVASKSEVSIQSLTETALRASLQTDGIQKIARDFFTARGHTHKFNDLDVLPAYSSALRSLYKSETPDNLRIVLQELQKVSAVHLEAQIQTPLFPDAVHEAVSNLASVRGVQFVAEVADAAVAARGSPELAARLLKTAQFGLNVIRDEELVSRGLAIDPGKRQLAFALAEFGRYDEALSLVQRHTACNSRENISFALAKIAFDRGALEAGKSFVDNLYTERQQILGMAMYVVALHRVGQPYAAALKECTSRLSKIGNGRGRSLIGAQAGLILLPLGESAQQLLRQSAEDAVTHRYATYMDWGRDLSPIVDKLLEAKETQLALRFAATHCDGVSSEYGTLLRVAAKFLEDPKVSLPSFFQALSTFRGQYLIPPGSQSTVTLGEKFCQDPSVIENLLARSLPTYAPGESLRTRCQVAQECAKYAGYLLLADDKRGMELVRKAHSASESMGQFDRETMAILSEVAIALVSVNKLEKARHVLPFIADSWFASTAGFALAEALVDSGQSSSAIYVVAGLSRNERGEGDCLALVRRLVARGELEKAEELIPFLSERAANVASGALAVGCLTRALKG